MNKQEESSLKVEVVTEWYANQRDRDYVLVFNSEIEILNGNYIRVDTTTENKSNYINDNWDNNSASPTVLAAKEYKNQQHQQLISTTFRGPTPSAARENKA